MYFVPKVLVLMTSAVLLCTAASSSTAHDPNGDFIQTDVSDDLTPLWYSNATLAKMVMKGMSAKHTGTRGINGTKRTSYSVERAKAFCLNTLVGDNPCRSCVWVPGLLCVNSWSKLTCQHLNMFTEQAVWCGSFDFGRRPTTNIPAGSPVAATMMTLTPTQTDSTSTNLMYSTDSMTSTTISSVMSIVTSISTDLSSTSTQGTVATPTTQPTTPMPTSSDGVVPAEILSALNSADWSKILISQQPDSSFSPSTVYHAPDMISAIVSMATNGVGSQKLWLGGSEPNAIKYGLVSIAAFLGQAMKETIQYDACDENNWNLPNGYSAANSCGQLGQAYDHYTCSASEQEMQCEIDPTKIVVAKTNAKWYGAPGPMIAAPRSILPNAPHWNYGSPWCDPNVAHPAFTSDEEYVRAISANDGSATCRMYSGQKAGGWELCNGGPCPNDPAPTFGVPARTDVEGCYFWGRGVIQTTGICNYGKLNYYLGAKAASDGRASMFPDVDFCQDPETICRSTKYPQLPWIAGLFYWLNAVQAYDDGSWNYFTELKKFVDGGLQNPGSDTGFIHGVSGIVNRGCPTPPSCGTGPLDGGSDRAANFAKVLMALKLV